MKINPYRGIFHSYAERAYKGVDLRVSVAVLPEYSTSPALTLNYKGETEKKTLKFSECASVGDAKVFSVTVPHEDFDSKSLFDYSIEDGIFTAFAQTVKVCELPVLPPVIITEVYSRPRRLKTTSKYIELTNISSENIDLYDIRLNKKMNGKETSCYLVSEPGYTFINSGETLVVRFLTKDSFDADGDIIESHEEYLKGIYTESPYVLLDYVPAKVIDVDGTRPNAKTGEREADPDVLALSPDQKPVVLSITKRDGSADDSYFEITLNENTDKIDVLNSRAALVTVDMADPHVGRIVRRNVDATPGVLDTRVAIPDFKNDKAPLIVLASPLAPHLSDDGEMVIEYSVYGGANQSYAELYLPDETKKIYAEKSDDSFTVTVPADVVRLVKELKVSLVAESGAYITKYGDLEDPLAFKITDNSGPVVAMISPKPDFCYSGETMPTVSAEFSDVSGVNIPACRIMLDGDDITDNVLWQGTKFVYKPAKALKYGEHKLKLTAYDLLGNCAKYSVRFLIAAYEDMNCYFGEVHNHTAESDGSATPTEAMEYARDVVGMDYFAVTEHSNYLIDDKYANQIAIANKYNAPGKFAALYGWEMTWNHTNGLWGHMNLIGAKDVIRDKDNYSLSMFYDWIEKHGGIAMFNHPGYPWGNFDEYSIPAEVANKVAALAEIKSFAYDKEYSHMLKRGYYVSPVYNDDTHSPNWGNCNTCTGYVLAPYLSRENVLEAFRERRTYSTSDRTLRMKYSINGKWLGSTLTDPEELNVKVELSTELDTGIGKLQLVTVNNIIVAELNVGLRKSYTWELKLPPEYPFYYVRIIGTGKYTVSAPVWIKGNEGISIRRLSVPSSFTEDLPAVVRFDLENTTDEVLRDVKADVYLSSRDGIKIGDLPYLTIYCGKLKAGEKIKVSRKLPVVNGNRALTVIASGIGKTATKRDSETVFLSQLLIAEVVSLTSPVIRKNEEGEDVTVQNPFSYVKLYNPSCKDMSLENVQIRLWTKAGKPPSEAHILTLKDAYVKANSTLVVWYRKDEALTVADFNSRYGTELTEGVDIITTKTSICKAEEGAKRVDIVAGGEVISRVTYNYCLESLGCELEEDKAFNYLYTPNFTGSSVRLPMLTVPNPAGVYEDQVSGSIIGGPKSNEIKAEKKAQKQEEKLKKDADKKGVQLPIVGGVAAAGAAAGAVVGSIFKAAKKVSPSAQAKADAKLVAKAHSKADKKVLNAENKLQKKSEKRMVKAISSHIDKTLDKKYAKKNVGAIDARMKSDKEAIKDAKKNMKVLKMQKKAEKAAAKREADIKKAQNS